MSLPGNFCGILLAAGASRRFGSDKLLHPMPAGAPLVLESGNNLRNALPWVVAAVRRDNGPLIDLLVAHSITVVRVPNAQDGMSASLAAAIGATAEASGWLVALADMPFIRPQTIAAVVAQLRAGARIAAPVYGGVRGHPVGFSRALRVELLALSGDEGARSVVEQNLDALKSVECDDPGILQDVDYAGDLAQAFQLPSRIRSA